MVSERRIVGENGLIAGKIVFRLGSDRFGLGCSLYLLIFEEIVTGQCLIAGKRGFVVWPRRLFTLQRVQRGGGTFEARCSLNNEMEQRAGFIRVG